MGRRHKRGVVPARIRRRRSVGAFGHRWNRMAGGIEAPSGERSLRRVRANLRAAGHGLELVITRLVQLDHPGFGRRVALADGEDLHLLGTYRSAYAFAMAAL